MKILIFEYICGGGLAAQPLPPSLAAEGSMMLQALLNELKSQPQLQLLIPLDERCQHLISTVNAEIVPIEARRDVLNLLPQLIQQCDAVWPIAPETDGVLADIARMVTAQQKILLASSADAISLCGDKFATHNILQALGLPVVASWLLKDYKSGAGRYVIKPRDGVGCLGGMLVEATFSADKLSPQARAGEGGDKNSLQLPVSVNPEQYIIQPYHPGQAISLSCLFKQGRGWLICCNQQQIQLVDNRFLLTGCLVNVSNDKLEYYRQLVDQVAAAIPGLWGYAGIDLLETAAQGPLILEINPRLTTSYVGIAAATGVNVAAQVLALLDSEPELPFGGGHTIEVEIS